MTREDQNRNKVASQLKKRTFFHIRPTNGLEGREKERLSFLIARDGLDEAKKFAKRGAKIYRNAVLGKKGLIHKKQFIESYLHFKRFI